MPRLMTWYWVWLTDLAVLAACASGDRPPTPIDLRSSRIMSQSPAMIHPGAIPVEESSERNALLLRGRGGQHSQVRAWPHEPRGFRIVTDYAFSALPGGSWRTMRPNVVSDPTAPLSPSGVVQWLYPKGFRAGSSPGTVYSDILTSQVNDHFVGYWFKLSNPFNFQSPNGIKMWYPYQSESGYHTRIVESRRFQIQVVQGAATANLAGNITDPLISLGVWHKVELYVKRPTTNSSPDGIFRWWIDGVLCGNHTSWIGPSRAPIVEWRFSPTWGGMGGSVAFDSYLWVDHVHVSQPDR